MSILCRNHHVSDRGPLRGRLVLVVGPSGAGKDTLIAGARAASPACPGWLFPRREITRPPGADGENYIAVTESVFRTREAAGAYALSWQAHGLMYGIPREIDDALAAGRTVIVNVSRAVLDVARQNYPNRCIISVNVPAAILGKRLRARGRESEKQISERLSRGSELAVHGPDVVEVNNDVPTAEAVAKFIEILRLK